MLAFTPASNAADDDRDVQLVSAASTDDDDEDDDDADDAGAGKKSMKYEKLGPVARAQVAIHAHRWAKDHSHAGWATYAEVKEKLSVGAHVKSSASTIRRLMKDEELAYKAGGGLWTLKDANALAAKVNAQDCQNAARAAALKKEEESVKDGESVISTTGRPCALPTTLLDELKRYVNRFFGT